MEHCNDADFDPRRPRFVQPPRPEFGVSFGAALEELAMHIGVIHRRAQRTPNIVRRMSFQLGE